MSDASSSNVRKRPSDNGSYGEHKRPRIEESADAPPATLRVLARNRDAGGIIGKGGDNIKRLRKEYDCHVMLPDQSGGPERVLTVMGEPEGCIGVMKEVLNRLPDNEFKEGERETQILIPQPFMGTIIGTGGTKINDLRAKTQCNIKIFSDPMPLSNERSIQLVGTINQIADCIRSFLEDISKKESREPIYLYEPGKTEFEDGPPFMGDFSPRGGRGRGGFRGRGRGFPPRGRGGPPSFHSSGPPRFKPSGPPPAMNAPPPSVPPTRPQFPVNTTPTMPPSVAPPTGVTGSVGYGATPPAVGYAGGSAPPATSFLPPASGQQGIPPQPKGFMPAIPPVVQSAPYTLLPPQQAPPITSTAMPVPLVPSPAQQSSQQVTIPLEYSDAILGVNGTRLQQIKQQSSCEITMNLPVLGATERVITIVGSSQGIQIAQQLMQSSVRQHHPNI